MLADGSFDVPGLTGLDPHETSEQQQDSPPRAGIGETDGLDVVFRHSGWMVDRDRVDRALEACNVATDRLVRFRACGCRAWVQRSRQHPDRLRIRADYCRDRWCKPCAAHRATIASHRLRDWLGGEPARFVTLTLAADGKPLTERLDRLYFAFKRLRRSLWWRRLVTGGLATIECKWSVKSAHWHPHLHILCRGRFLPVEELAKHWHVATGDSFIVDIQLVDDPRSTASYLAKYISKPGSATVYADPNRLQEMIVALTGRRLLMTFGDCKLKKTPEETDPDDWDNVAPLGEVLAGAAHGIATDVAILAALGVIPCATASTRSPPPCRRSSQDPLPTRP
jgi:hypothetical protein